MGGIVFFGFSLVSKWATPSGHFDLESAPRAPDYSQDIFWAAMPGKKDLSDVQPEGLDSQAGLGVDIFYIHPTGYFSGKNWNAPVGPDAPGGRYGPRALASAMLGAQASAFNVCGAVFAPHYRQATLTAYSQFWKNPPSPNGGLALELAYGDVARAFDYFIEHFNEGRPFIVASHSQGTTHAIRLLAEKIDDTDLRKRMVVAYLLGFKLPLDIFERLYKNLLPCDKADDTGCVVAWDTFGEGGTKPWPLYHWYPTGWESSNEKDTLCVNPLSWDRAGQKVVGKGRKSRVDFQLWGSGGSVLSSPRSGAAWAECKDGVLYVSEQEGYISMGKPAEKNYHIYDYSLFYMDIRKNAHQRSKRFLGTADSKPNKIEAKYF